MTYIAASQQGAMTMFIFGELFMYSQWFIANCSSHFLFNFILAHSSCCYLNVPLYWHLVFETAAFVSGLSLLKVFQLY